MSLEEQFSKKYKNTEYILPNGVRPVLSVAARLREVLGCIIGEGVEG